MLTNCVNPKNHTGIPWVSILVLVDLAHECQVLPCLQFLQDTVSILVLVDLAHELPNSTKEDSEVICFNPCFSGSCSRIVYYFGICFNIGYVSILVLVDLAHESTDWWTCRSIQRVSILVLVDLAHEFRLSIENNRACLSFNPCFSGSCSRIFWQCSLLHTQGSSFNPCFSGSCSRITAGGK
ncbi:hypothetical protein MSBRM_2642 [Methanosarcina barkeri MS]|uniref:Uncharacterized protein n=1 Tax=Methanosarcina barkeri MS TaxID=1434108 RepID=A0A0E3QVS2_METBA|nr:hypothetical protein MSBRM_2642 [Methanosarcina barkeri MS]